MSSILYMVSPMPRLPIVSRDDAEIIDSTLPRTTTDPLSSLVSDRSSAASMSIRRRFDITRRRR